MQEELWFAGFVASLGLRPQQGRLCVSSGLSLASEEVLAKGQCSHHSRTHCSDVHASYGLQDSICAESPCQVWIYRNSGKGTCVGIVRGHAFRGLPVDGGTGKRWMRTSTRCKRRPGIERASDGSPAICCGARLEWKRGVE